MTRRGTPGGCTRMTRRTALQGAAAVVAGIAAQGLRAVVRTEGVRAAPAATLQFWFVYYAQPLLQQTLIDFGTAFERSHPGVRVQTQSFPFVEYFQKVNTAFAGGQAPDVFFADFPEVAGYVYRKQLVPLDEFVSTADLDDYYDGPRQDMAYQGHIWSLPMHQSTEELLYNVDLVQRAELQPPHIVEQQWTWGQFLKAAEAVVERKDGRVTTWAYTTTYTPPDLYVIQPWLAMAGGAVLSPDATRATGYLNSSDTARGLTFWSDLYTKRQLAPIQPTPDLFATGKAVFMQGNPFVLRDLEQRFPNFRAGVTFLPKERRAATNSGGWHLGISSQTKQRELAWQLVDSIAGREGHLKWTQTSGYLPARKSAYARMPFLKHYPWTVFWDGVVRFGVSRPRTPAWDFIHDLFYGVSKDTQLGHPAKPVLDAAAARIDQELVQYKR